MCQELGINLTSGIKALQLHSIYNGWRCAIWAREGYSVEQQLRGECVDLDDGWQASQFRLVGDQVQQLTVTGAPYELEDKDIFEYLESFGKKIVSRQCIY